jgi:hypothetical protein
MSFERADPTVKAWAEDLGLVLFTEYKDEPVRSVQLVGKRGQRAQIWVDPPGESGDARVHVWDYKRRRQDFAGRVDSLRGLLDTAALVAQGWISDENDGSVQHP